MSLMIELNKTYQLSTNGKKFNKSIQGTEDEEWILPSHITVQSHIKVWDMYLVSLMGDDTITLAPHTIEDYYEPL